MKNTIITLASIAMLAGVANAQTYTKDTWDFSGVTAAQVNSAAGQDFDVLGNGQLTVNLKATGADVPTNYVDYGTTVGFIGGASDFTFTWEATSNTGYNVQGITYSFGPLSADETVTSPFTAAGNLVDLGGGVYQGVGTGDGSGSGNFSVVAGATPAWSATFTNTTGTGNNFKVSSGVVPEPSSTALLGLGGLALILRRKK